MATDLTWRKAIDKVLKSSATPLHYNEITERIISEGLRKNLGATPSATVNALLAASIKHDGDSSPYFRVSKGVFAMRHSMSILEQTHKNVSKIPVWEDEENQYDVISSFGMFWRKDAIEWTRTPRILGMQQIGTLPVDFCKQVGIYLLYDGREVIYVGRSTDRPLGRRLYEHTLDRLSDRWDRFSWFGLLSVSETGQLGRLPESFNAAKLIPALEAILIEALEPRQNRKRGDDLAAVEYIQKIDPEIEKRKLQGYLQTIMSKA